MSNPTTPSAESLLSHAAWVGALAVSLVRDASEAEDLAQEVLLEALRRPPRQRGPWRPWLKTVAKNRARRLARESQRRTDRERKSALSEVEDREPADIVQRASLQRQVVNAVLDLDEPYRTTVLLRYFDGLTPAKIAKRQSVPVSTVQTRLKRGRARLREALAPEPSQRQSWALAMVALLSESQRALLRGSLMGVSWWAGGVLLMTTTTKASLIVLAIAGWALFEYSFPSAPASDPLDAGSPGDHSLLADVRPSLPEVNRREPVEPSKGHSALISAANAAEKSTSPKEVALRGRVFSQRGDPVSDAWVLLRGSVGALNLRTEGRSLLRRYRSGELPDGYFRAITDPNGHFSFAEGPVKGSWDLLACHPDRGIAARSGMVPEHSLGEVLLTLEPGVVLSGRISDPSGAPLAGANVSVMSYGEENTVNAPDWVQSDPFGDYRSLTMPGNRFLLSLRAPSFYSTHRVVEVPPGSEAHRVDFVLEPAPRWSGRITDPHGQPAGLREAVVRRAGESALKEVALFVSRLHPSTTVNFRAGSPVEGTIELQQDGYEIWPEQPEDRFVSVWVGDALLGWVDRSNESADSDIVVDVEKIPAKGPFGTLTLQILHEGSREPVSRGEVRLWCEDAWEEEFFGGKRFFLDPATMHGGAFTVSEVPYGDCRLRVSSGESAVILRTEVRSEDQRLVVELPPVDGSLTVRVTGESGRVPESTELTLLNEDGEFWFPVASQFSINEQGTCLFSVPRGKYWVVVIPQDQVHGALAQLVEVDQNSTAEVIVPRAEMIRLESRGTARGPFEFVIRDSRGIPVIESRRDGRRHFGAGGGPFYVAPGDYTVEVRCPSFTLEPFSVASRSDEAAVEFEMQLVQSSP